MNRQQTYRGPSFYVGWMEGTLVCNNSFFASNLWDAIGKVEL